MKTLYLMRHATADDHSPDSDFERALSPQGVAEAQRMAEHLAALEPHPSLVLCSSARRTRETLACIEKHLPADTQIATSRALYLASAEHLLQSVAEVDDAHAAILVVAHFPGVAELWNSLASSGDGASRSRMARHCPPAALAALSLEGTRWAETRPNCARLLEFTRPEDLD